MSNIQSFSRLFGIFAKTRTHLLEAKKPEADVSKVTMNWAKQIMGGLDLEIEVIGEPSKEESILFVGNHISYLDIPLLLANVEKLAFVAKKEVHRWPFIGPGAAKIGTVFVKRSSTQSRNAAKLGIQSAIKNGKRVAIFPSGTTSIHNKKPWKKGAFDIAAESNCLLQPFRITYTPLREVAYIDNDFFPIHVMKLHKQKAIKAKLEFHPPLRIEDPIKECERWNEWSNTPF